MFLVGRYTYFGDRVSVLINETNLFPPQIFQHLLKSTMQSSRLNANFIDFYLQIRNQ